MNYAPGAMISSDWNRIKQLNAVKGHNWGNAQRICRRVIMTLEDFLVDQKLKALVTCGTGGEHTEGSYHYPTEIALGCALDVMFPELQKKDIPDVYHALCKFDFRGIGLYSKWKLGKDQPEIGGVHVDTRPKPTRALWLKGGKTYEPITTKNLQKYFLG